MHKMNIDLNMFCASMVDRVGGHVHRTHIVAVDNGGTMKSMMNILQQLTKPTTLGNNVCYRSIFGLYTGVGNRSLTLGEPVDKVITEVNAVAKCGATRVGTASPIRI